MALQRSYGKRIYISVFIDAFGWELLERHSFLDDLLVTKAPLQTVLGYSSTCIPTILTGAPPREHGHFAFFRYTPDASPFGHLGRLLGALPAFVEERARVRHWISRGLQAIFGWDGYFQIYNTPFEHLEFLDYSEKRDLYMPFGINGGQKTLFDRLHDKGVPFHVSNWRLSEEANLSRLARALDGADIEFAYLYLAAMDGLLHAEGTGSAQVAVKVAWYERKLRDIVALAHRRYRDVVLSVFSDHGMTDTRETSNLMLRVEALDLRYGLDYAAVYDSTMARFWFMTERARRRIVALLTTEDRGRVLAHSELVELGVDFENHEYGELIFLMDPGVLICPSFMGRQPIAGMHGFHPNDKDSVAMFASSETPPVLPQRLTDLHDVLLDGAIHVGRRQ